MSNKKIRIDKWLWAARFFKTRSIASDAINGGKVHLDGARVKASKEVRTGEQYTIRQGHSEKTIIVLALSDKRGPASEAIHLYEETEQSIEKRQQQRAATVGQAANRQRGAGRPTKRERRHIISFTQGKNRSPS